MSQLKEYCSIYYFIKATNKPLRELIKETCTKHLFNFRHITFLMPNSALLNKMKKEKPSVAAKMLKSLLLRGAFKNPADLKDEVYNMMGQKLNNPSNLKVKVDPKFIQWEGYENLAVLLYDGSDIPSAEERKPTAKKEEKKPADKKEEKKAPAKKKTPAKNSKK